MYLIDSHVLIWNAIGDPQLSGRHLDLLHSDARLFVSVASLWEIEIKLRAGRLDLPENFNDLMLEKPYEFLQITEAHALAAARLPRLHGDPFDRMLIAQAQAEGLTILSEDRWFAGYEVEVV